MQPAQLYEHVLRSGSLPSVSAYRLRNIVVRCFAPRYLRNDASAARWLKRLLPTLTAQEQRQLFFIYTCRANPILGDFIRQVYWGRYAAGNGRLTKADAEGFIHDAMDAGKTPSRWADGQVKRVGRYLTGSCTDFGLLAGRSSKGRQMIPYRIESKVGAYLAHDLHFAGQSDNAIVSSSDWALFGLDRNDVLEELKRQSLKGYFILQTAGGTTHISWKYRQMEEFVNVLANG